MPHKVNTSEYTARSSIPNMADECTMPVSGLAVRHWWKPAATIGRMPVLYGDLIRLLIKDSDRTIVDRPRVLVRIANCSHACPAQLA
jgi:hypothetical protein